jgi:mono/diheme cytochrome c family protein
MNLYRINVGLLVLLVVTLAGAWSLRTDPTRPNWQWMPDMVYSPAYDSFRPNPNFANGQTLQAPPRGTIARGQVVWHSTAAPEDAIRAGQELVAGVNLQDPATIERGAEVYRVFCRMCHGPQGMGDGPVARRGYPPPPPLPAGKSVEMRDGQLFHILTYGQGSMAPYASQISPPDRWNVIAYVRKLQADARPAAAAPAEATTRGPAAATVEGTTEAPTEEGAKVPAGAPAGAPADKATGESAAETPPTVGEDKPDRP